MRSDVKSELQMLREIAYFFLLFNGRGTLDIPTDDYICMFCNKLLIPDDDTMTFGHRRHPKFPVKLTVHHLDEDRGNNRKYNLALVHTSCHKRYHAERNARRKEENNAGQTIQQG